ncbi:hypothetical protein O181_023268 [Austropuccinia psidii MF-1]|uniref:Uncharacterized protein n=1 Tax=Austropuccinia psidii MF-1 TaxID=1389203 RepID=A0A9Q3CIG6_9BASI|nr:hypothetical protein [Austropuccinia psidii MF-1]
MLRWQIAIQEYRGNINLVKRYGNINRDADRLNRFSLPNDVENPDFVPEESSPQIPMKLIIITDLNTTFFKEVRDSYTQDINFSILFQLLSKSSKDNSLIHSLDEIWKVKYDEGICHLFMA